MPDWMHSAWIGVTGWVAFVFAVAKAIQATYAAERDRAALASVDAERQKLALEIKLLQESLSAADLQREKLALEVQLLKNSTEVVADRRAIYERLRELLREIHETAAPTYEQVVRMYQIQHDSEFAFPRALSERLKRLNKSVFDLWWSHRQLTERQAGMNEAQRQSVVTDNHAALNEVIAFQVDMVEAFRDYLNRTAE